MPGFPDWLSQQIAQSQLLIEDTQVNATGTTATGGVPSWAFGVIWTAAVVGGNADFNPFYLQVDGAVSGAHYVYPTGPGAGGEPMSGMRPMLAHPVASAVDTSLNFTVRFIAGGSGNPVHVRAYAVNQIPDMPLPPLKFAGGISIAANTILVPAGVTNVFRLEGASIEMEAGGTTASLINIQATIRGVAVSVARLAVASSGQAVMDYDLHGLYTDPGISVLANVSGGPADAVPNLYYRQMA